MKRTASGLKRKRQTVGRNNRNRIVLSGLKTQIKKLNSALTAKNIEEAKPLLNKLVSGFDRAGSKGVFHRNTVARKVSRFTLKVNKLGSAKETS